MGWKRAVRTIGAAVRAAERDARRRQRELERNQKQYQKMQELEQAAYEVDLYENHLDVICSIHKECSPRIDWKAIATTQEPPKPINQKKRETLALSAFNNFKPNLFDKIFGREEKRRKKLENNISTSAKEDEAEHLTNLSNWETAVNEQQESVALAKRLLNGDKEAKIEVIDEIEPFSEISNLGSRLQISFDKDGTLEATINIHGDEIVPSDVKSLLKSGKLSTKKMPKGQFNEIYQDYVCSCVLRVANELFSTIPDDLVVVTAIDNMLNTKTGHLEESPILSAAISRKTINSLDMDNIDPSDSMSNFIHNMSFKKTTGFSATSRIQMSKE